MKKKIFFLLIILFSLFLTGCNNEQKIKEEEEKKETGLLTCLSNKIGGYIATQYGAFKEVPKNTYTSNSQKIEYYNSHYVDDDNIYAIIKTNDSKVVEDFDLYFSNKYDLYQNYFIDDNIYIYIYNKFNDIDFSELNDCSKNSNKLEEGKIDFDTIEKLSNTNKLIIKSNETSLATISDKIVITNILNVISNSIQYGNAFNCDGPSFEFEMYNNNDLIDTIYVWGDGRLIPKSIHKGCGYYIASNSFNAKKFIESETDYIFYTIYDYSHNSSTMELIYEDNEFNYYCNCTESNKILIKFASTNIKMSLKYALNNNYIKPKQLTTYTDIIIKKEK